MFKRKYWLMFLGLFLISNYAFARAGFGHGGFRGGRSYGRSVGFGMIDFSVLGVYFLYNYIKSKWLDSSSSNIEHSTNVRNNSIEGRINQLFKENHIDKNATQLKNMFADVYISLQQAWMKQDLSLAKQVLSDQLIQELNKPLNSLKKRQLVDYMRAIEFSQIKLINMSRKKQKLMIRVQMTGLMVDERIHLNQLDKMDEQYFMQKPFSDVMVFSYEPHKGWKAEYLKVK